MPTIYSKKRGAPLVPPGAISVDRSTPWGNPFVMRQERDRDAVCDAFEQSARDRLTREPGWLAPLRGADLVCWCQSPADVRKKRCHAETLLRLANMEGEAP